MPNDSPDMPDWDGAEMGADANTIPVIAQLAQQAARAERVEEGIHAILQADGSIQLVETPGYQQQRERSWETTHADQPDRIERAVTLLDVASFVDYLDRNTIGDPGKVDAEYLFGNGSLELWGDLDARKITAILDGLDGWRRHTATLLLKVSREWSEWVAIDGKLLDQVTFAQFIEDHLSTIAEPAGATLLDICQTLEAQVGASFKQQTILSNGQRQFRWEETVEAKAGQKGDITIPGELTLVLRPFQGSAAVPMTARFRFRPGADGLKLGVKLGEPDKALEDAFALVVADVQESVPVHVNNGRG